MSRAAETYPVLSLAERDRRWELLRNFMDEQRIECLVIAGPLETRALDRYVTNFLTGWVIFQKAGDPILMTPRAYVLTQAEEIRAMGEAPLWSEDIRAGATGKDLARLLGELGHGSADIGVVGLSLGLVSREGWIPYSTWDDTLAGLPDANFLDVTFPFIDLIGVKSEEELGMVRKAADVAELACEEMLNAVKPGVRESDVVAAVMGVIYSHGCVGSLLPHLGPLILQSGPKTPAAGPPRWVTRGGQPRTLEKGDYIHAEIFSIYGGYEAQAHMGISIGTPDDALIKAEKVVRVSYEEGLKALVPGTRFSDVGTAMEKPFREGSKFGTGVLIHSLNTVFFSSRMNVAKRKEEVSQEVSGGGQSWKGEAAKGRGRDFVVRENMVFEVEPKCSIDGRGVYIGSTVIVTGKGVVELNKLGKRMHQV